MIVVAQIVDGPIGAAVEWAVDAPRPACGTAGAVIRFEGIVRRLEPAPSAHAPAAPTAPATPTVPTARSTVECALEALDYETYDPMAERELTALARRTAEAHGLLSIMVLHSRGRVAVGEVSFMLEISAPHRAEALRAMSDFIDQLKRDVPIWKRPVWAA